MRILTYADFLKLSEADQARVLAAFTPEVEQRLEKRMQDAYESLFRGKL
jgi:hypothetical protein